MSSSETLRILIVEDEWISAKFMQKVFEDLGHVVVGIVRSGVEALKMSSSNSIDLVFMDINLHGSMDGIMCAKSLNEKYQIPVVYISAYTDRETLDEVSLTNIYGYIRKPFDKQDIEIALSVAIPRLLDSREARMDKAGFINLGNDYLFNTKTHTLMLSKDYVHLSKSELKILSLLVKHIDHMVSIDALSTTLWGSEIKSMSTLRNIVSSLRMKIAPVTIKTIHGVGYILVKSKM